MIKWLLSLFSCEHAGDLSKHRLYSTNYDDLCK